MSNTRFLWKGLSQYTDNPIEAFITLKSTNTKTGDNTQITILPMDV